MSNIINEPKYKNSILQSVRGTLEHRAIWIYLLLDEANNKELVWEDFGKHSINRCGCSQDNSLISMSGTNSLKGLKKTLFTLPARLFFGMRIKDLSDNKLYINFHYYPLVKAWQKQGCIDEEIIRLCDIRFNRPINIIFSIYILFVYIINSTLRVEFIEYYINFVCKK